MGFSAALITGLTTLLRVGLPNFSGIRPRARISESRVQGGGSMVEDFGTPRGTRDDKVIVFRISGYRV